LTRPTRVLDRPRSWSILEANCQSALFPAIG
jgi:hypothetical protein